MARRRLMSGWRLLALTAVGLVLLLLTLRSSVASLHRARGASDAPTIRDGDLFFVDRTAYDIRVPVFGTPVIRRAEPRRGDVVLFSAPDRGVPMTKRIVAIAGDVVGSSAGRLVVNGVPARYRATDLDGPADGTIEEWDGLSYPVMGATTLSAESTTVPADHVYVLGDNRSHSVDSRDFGPVPRRAIHGRVLVGKPRRR